MGRKKWAEPGEMYAIDWPEWFVTCGQGDCGASELACPTGEATTLRDAMKQAREADNNGCHKGWEYARRKWWCPEHAPNRDGTKHDG